MIFCEVGDASDASLDILAVFVSQARANGLPVVISEESLPEALKAAHEFDISSFVTSATPMPGDRLALLINETIDAECYGRLRKLVGASQIECLAFGTFADRQTQITLASRLAYTFSKEPVIADFERDLGFATVATPVFSAPPGRKSRLRPKIALYSPDLESEAEQAKIRDLSLKKTFDIEIITNGAAKQDWVKEHGYDIPIWHMGELLPNALAQRYDGCIFFDQPTNWPRFQAFVANLVASGAILVDATYERAWNATTPEVIAGPSDIRTLGMWLVQDALPAREQIRAELMKSPLARKFQMPPVLKELKPAMRSLGGHAQMSESRKVVFVPTNGVGLGHAKRCSLIADKMRAEATPSFAAFPSCIGMLTASGFDTMPLVSRTPQRVSHANDLVNYTRLSSYSRDASGFVFDGGYIFDGIMRTISDNALPSVWIRRGLWQAAQNNNVALDREKVFSRIVVPTEAFDELNAPVSRAENVVEVGPIVQQLDMEPDQRNALRETLTGAAAESKKLVVTMLGGGVAADRCAQINAICAHLEAREDVRHILVVWPTAKAHPSWFNFKNTKVVKSIHASALIPSADLFISAIGYNSFHEAVYAGVPSIFIPQMASFMDDQRARGKAAAERDLAVLIEPWEMLNLTRAIDECLEGRCEDMREKLRGINLPQPGMSAAADQILEVCQ